MLLMMTLAVASCSPSVRPRRQITARGISMELVLSPNPVSVGDSIRAVATLRNMTGDTVHFIGRSCLARFTILLGAEVQLGFQAVAPVCPEEMRGWDLSPRGAIIWERHVGVGTGRTLPTPNRYRFRVEFLISPALPALEQEFEVH